MLPVDTIICGDCRQEMARFPDNHFHAVITDPPYELGFMGKSWDASGIAYDPVVWSEVFRVLRPGGYLLAFGGTRTYHRMACAIEETGFILHPMIGWVFGSGFPKATNLSKQFDKEAGAKREIIGRDPYFCAGRKRTFGDGEKYGTAVGGDEETAWMSAPFTDAAKTWDGWFYGRQSLKPAIEPICIASKPFNTLTTIEEVKQAINCLELLIWCMLGVASVESGLMLDQIVRNPKIIAQWSATIVHSIKSGALSEKTVMFKSQAMASTFWSTVLLWSSIWEDLSEKQNWSITETGIDLTTSWRILNLSIWPIIRPFITQELTDLNGNWLDALPVEKISGDLNASSRNIQKHTAIENAILQAGLMANSVLASIAASLSISIQNQNGLFVPERVQTRAAPKTELIAICMAQKPPEGRMTENVLRWGCGAVNVDGCRIPGNYPSVIKPNGGKTSFGNINDDGWEPTKSDFPANKNGRFPSNLLLGRCSPSTRICDFGNQ